MFRNDLRTLQPRRTPRDNFAQRAIVMGKGPRSRTDCTNAKAVIVAADMGAVMASCPSPPPSPGCGCMNCWLTTQRAMLADLLAIEAPKQAMLL
jgi:hypothetical protein